MESMVGALTFAGGVNIGEIIGALMNAELPRRKDDLRLHGLINQSLNRSRFARHASAA